MDMDMNQKNEFIKQYIENLAEQINSQYKGLVDDEKIEKAYEMFKDSPDDLETVIIPKINELAQQLIDEYLKLQEEQMNGPEEGQDEDYNPEELDTKLESENQGVYLSSLMIPALALITCSNIGEINEWLDSIPNLYMLDSFQNGEYSPEQLESIKRDLFGKYQDSMISTEAFKEISSKSEEDSLRYSLHKKLAGLGLPIEDELSLGSIGLTAGLPTLYKEIEKRCLGKYGQDKGSSIFQKIVNYYPVDYENFNSSTFDQIKAFGDKIKESIKKCGALGGDFQLIIGSLGFGNTVKELLNNSGNPSFSYNFDISAMGQKLAEKLGASYRLRSMINRNTAEEMAEKGFGKADKQSVIQILRDSLSGSLQSFLTNMKKDGKLRTFELLNELIEIKKDNRDYKGVWDRLFGISLEDISEKVVKPNMPFIKELKANNVDFMYNETLLQESKEKRSKVMDTVLKLQTLIPGVINVFGDQDHTFSSDYNKDKIDQLKEVAQLDKDIAKIVIGKDANGEDVHMKVESSEKDLHFTKEDLQRFIKLDLPKQEVLKQKQTLLNKHSGIFSSVPFKRACEWAVLGNISGHFLKEMLNPNQESFIGKFINISDMAKDVTQVRNKDVSSFNKWKSTVKQFVEQKKQGVTTQAVQNSPKNKAPFTQRSQKEVQLANQIKQKNQAIKQQKSLQKINNKQKVKTLTYNPNRKPNSNAGTNKGYVKSFSLSLIISIIAVASFILIYMIIG